MAIGTHSGKESFMRVTGTMRKQKLQFDCYFCGLIIKSKNLDPCDINILVNLDKEKKRQYN